MSRPVIEAVLFVLSVACINVPTKVGAAAWERCFELLAERGDIFGINEAGSWRAKRLYRRLARELGYAYFGLFIGPNPAFWDRRIYRRHSARQVKLHDRGHGRKARLWPGFNDARYMTVVVLERLAGGPLTTYINLHFVAPGKKVPSRWRAQMRARSIARLRTIVANHLAAGRVVVVNGDANRDAFAIDGVTWLDGNGPDLVAIAVPAGVDLGDVELEHFPAPTDHKHGVSAAIEIGAAA